MRESTIKDDLSTSELIQLPPTFYSVSSSSSFSSQQVILWISTHPQFSRYFLRMWISKQNLFINLPVYVITTELRSSNSVGVVVDAKLMFILHITTKLGVVYYFFLSYILSSVVETV